MNNYRRRGAFGSAARIGVVLLCLNLGLAAFTKKLEVKVLQTTVHMKPDLRSPVIATLSQGEVLILASARKFKREWNYVYFPSQKNGALKAGYVRDAAVTRLFINTRSVTYSTDPSRTRPREKAQPAPKTIEWGMKSGDLARLLGNPSRVRSQEGTKIFCYQRRVMGRGCRIEHVFRRDHLIKTRYIFLDEYPQQTRYIEEYLRLNAEFSQRYGEPEEEKKLWHDPVLKNNPQEWGQAISLGHLSYQTRWQLSSTEIVLSLAGSKSQIMLELLYSSLISD